MKQQSDMEDASGAGDHEPRDTAPLIPRILDTLAAVQSLPPCTVVMASSSSSEIVKDDGDVEAGSAPSCRICLECDADHGGELISPCMCKGTQQFVHRSCLNHWRSVKEGFAFSHCTTCKARYHLRVVLYETNSWRKLKFRLFVARDLLLGFLAVQTVIAAIGALAYLIDKDGAFRNSFSDGWDVILSKHPIPFYYCVGVVIFFVLLGICGLLIQCLLCCGPMECNADPCCPAYVYYGFDPCTPTCEECSCDAGDGSSAEACLVFAIVVVVIFTLLGIVYGFIVATLGVQHVWQRHYYILTKRELTQEYIVEDLHGHYTPPKLDRELEERLKTLKLL